MKRVNGPPIPDTIRVLMESDEQQWKEVLQVFEDQGWEWPNGNKPTVHAVDYYYNTNYPVILIYNSDTKTICRSGNYYEESLLISAKEFLEKYGSKIEYEVGDWVVILKDQGGDPVDTITQIVEIRNDSSTVFVKNMNKEHPNTKTWNADTPCIRPATLEEIASVVNKSSSTKADTKQVDKDQWQVGDVLPEKWLRSEDIEDYDGFKGASRGKTYQFYCGNRTVKEVKEGWALISGTADIWLAPKDQYPTYPGNSTVKKEPVVQKHKYHVDNAVGTKVAINCSSIEQYKTVVAVCDKMGKGQMQSGTAGWATFSDKVCVQLYKYPGYSDIAYYTDLGYTIITAEEFLRDNGVEIPTPVPVAPWSIVTTDGVTVYAGTKVWWTRNTPQHPEEQVIDARWYKENTEAGWKVFSTYEAAEEFRKKQVESSDYIWDGDVLPSEYWVENPNIKSCEIAKYLKMLPGGSFWTGDGHWYKVDSKLIEAYEKKYEDDLPIVPYELWKKLLTKQVEEKEKMDKIASTEKETVTGRKWKIGDRFKLANDEDTYWIEDVDPEDGMVWVNWRSNKYNAATYELCEVDYNWGRTWIPIKQEPIPVTADNAFIGMKVVRGKDWKWNDQDNAGTGIVTEVEERWCSVKWHIGGIYSYRIGHSDKYDLYVAPEEVNTTTVNQTINQQTKTKENGNKNSNQQQDNYSGKEIKCSTKKVSTTQSSQYKGNVIVPKKSTNILTGKRATGSVVSSRG